ncbi:hypothetical protein [Streptomyces capitiformicae]|uniref:Uncharacterized protein n=1 Tax=Streptomyces capitiformicae TaxID=2014920 RepID=A0A918ZEI1_9ACTN|nr:hypothetical protein [Streptomyces capitiformicae]GHE47303.1 hypothetical protein GCM10017771_68070 [Streptomyces capitiformicae]
MKSNRQIVADAIAAWAADVHSRAASVEAVACGGDGSLTEAEGATTESSVPQRVGQGGTTSIGDTGGEP